jgi:hypothetical protein
MLTLLKMIWFGRGGGKLSVALGCGSGGTVVVGVILGCGSGGTVEVGVLVGASCFSINGKYTTGSTAIVVVAVRSIPSPWLHR